MREIVTSGRSVEEAVNEGLEVLGARRDAVKVDVLDEGTKGLFGLLGGRMARVRLTVLADETGTRGAGEANSGRVSAEESGEAQASVEDSGAGAEKEEVSAAVRDQKTANATDFLGGLVQRMGVSGDIASKDDGEYVALEITGRKLGILIGRRGQTLDALQYLVNVVANQDGKNWVRFIVDAEDYRKRREETLRHLALRVAEKAKTYGRRQALEPMTPQERRIIHTTLQDDPEVTTYSEGEEPYRRVIVGLRNEPGGERPSGRTEGESKLRYGYGSRSGGTRDSL